MRHISLALFTMLMASCGAAQDTDVVFEPVSLRQAVSQDGVQRPPRSCDVRTNCLDRVYCFCNELCSDFSSPDCVGHCFEILAEDVCHGRP